MLRAWVTSRENIVTEMMTHYIHTLQHSYYYNYTQHKYDQAWSSLCSFICVGQDITGLSEKDFGVHGLTAKFLCVEMFPRSELCAVRSLSISLLYISASSMTMTHS